jgi:Tol biopolymer transport system component
VTAFSSLADNLVSSDGNAFPDVFVVQQGSSEIDRVDRQGSVPDGPSQFVALSGDGNTLAFVSLASNLVEVDRNGAQDIFAYDRRTGDIELISRNTAGVQANAPSGFPSLSADGRYVAFDSFATNLVPDGDGLRNAFLFDRDTDSIERISNAIGGGNANGPSSRPVISGNGRFVLFGSAATNLVRDMPTVPGGDELFLHDRDTGATRHLDFRRDPAVSRHLLGSYAISSDGQVVAMELAAPLDLPLDLFNNELLEFDLPRTDIHVFEVVSQTLSRVSNGIGGADPNRSSFAPSLSAGGRYVAFHSAASNLDSGDLDAGDDIYLFDRQTSTTRLLSVNEQGTKGNGPSGGAVLSRNGQVIAFASLATNLVDDDNNLFTDVFVAATGIETQITLDGSNQTLDLSQPNVWLDGIEQIDIRGTGHNLLKLDAIKIKAQLEPDELIVVADPGDTIRFDAGWKFSGVSVVAGQFQRVFVNGDTTVRLIGPRSWTNPLLAADVNGENGVTALDALNIINELPRGRLVDDLGSLRDPTTIESALFNFFDPSGDGKMTAGDALFVINRIGRAPDETASEGSDTIAEVDATLAATADWLAATLPPA